MEIQENFDFGSEHDTFGNVYILELENMGFAFDERSNCYSYLKVIDDNVFKIKYTQDCSLEIDMGFDRNLVFIDPSIDFICEVIERFQI